MRTNAGKSSQYVFSVVPNANIPRCKLHRPSLHKTTMNVDYLYPLYFDEVLPGDTFKVDVSMVARLTALLAPIMDNLYLDMQFFFVPNRLVWSHWNNMCGERENPEDSIDYTVPYISAPSGGVTAQTIGDYFGLPLGVEWSNHDVMALPFRAYNLIWNEWYRDANLQDSVTVKKDDTADSLTNYTLLKRNKRKDYFTSALPWPAQLINGSQVTIPLGTSAPVIGNGTAIGFTDGTLDGITLSDRAAGQSNAHLASLVTGQGGEDVGTTRGNNFYDQAKLVGLSTDKAKSGLIADLSNSEGASINAIRQAFQLQRLLERDARGGGNRYVTLLRSHFNVVCPDLRLQRPEFLGSFTVPINVHSIVQTSESNTTPQGTLAGVGTVNGVNRAFIKSFTEHGMIIGLASIRADLSYQQGIHRKWSRSSRFDFYWPALCHLGEQAILNKEIFAQGASAVDDDGNKVDDKAFGFQERWSEYKYGYNLITGQLRSTYSAPLDFWHLAQEFSNLPTLNTTFISENVPLDRCVALTSETAPQFVVDCLFDSTCIRPMPLYDVPGLIDHF